MASQYLSMVEATVVEEIVQELYPDMKRDLNIVDTVDLMFEKRFIDTSSNEI